MKDTLRRIAVLLLTAALLVSTCSMGLAEASPTAEETSAGEQTEVPAEPASAPAPTQAPAPEPTAAPEAEPTAEPEAEPTAEPEAEPEAEPTAEPEAEPTAAPAEPGTEQTAPTEEPGTEPTAEPEVSPEPDASPEPEETPEPDAALAAVQAMVDALPTAEELEAMDESAQDAVYAQLQAAYDAFQALSEEQQAQLIGAEKFEALFGVFNAMTDTTAFAYQYYDPSDGRMHDMPTPFYTPEDVSFMRDVALTAGGEWILVNEDFTLAPMDRGSYKPLPIQGSGTVNILLLDGATLTIPKGFKFTSAGQSVTIWGQSGQSGKLVVTGENNPAFDGGPNSSMGGLTINGGVVEISTRTDKMLTLSSVAINAGDVYFDYKNDSDNGPVVGGTLTIAPGAIVSGGDVEKSNPTDGRGHLLHPVPLTTLSEMTRNWGSTYTLDGRTFAYRTGYNTSTHRNCALWMTPGDHTLTTADGSENFRVTVGEDGTVTWSKIEPEEPAPPEGDLIHYYDPNTGETKEVYATKLDDRIYAIGSGWYYIEGKVNLTYRSLRVHGGSVNLVLKDKSNLYCTTSITLDKGAGLTIWGESASGSGVINVTNEGVPADWVEDTRNGGLGYRIGPALGGGQSFTLTINGGTVNATANRSDNTAPAVGIVGSGQDNYTASIVVNGGSLTARSDNGAPAIGMGFSRRGWVNLYVNGGSVTAGHNNGTAAGGYAAIGHYPANGGTVHVYMNGGALTTSGKDVGIVDGVSMNGGTLHANGNRIGIDAPIDYRGGDLYANGGDQAVTNVPDFTATIHRTDVEGHYREDTFTPRSLEEWVTWKDIHIYTQEFPGLKLELSPESLEVANGSTSQDEISCMLGTTEYRDKVVWELPSGFSLDGEWRLHVADNVVGGTYTITARFGNVSASIEVTVNTGAWYYDPDTTRSYPVPQLLDPSDTDYTLANGAWYSAASVDGKTVTVPANANANLLLEDGDILSEKPTSLSGVTLGDNATLTIWNRVSGVGGLDLNGTVGTAGNGSALVIKGGAFNATDATVLCPIQLRDGAVLMDKAPAAGVVTAGGSLMLMDAAGANVKNEAGEDLVCAELNNMLRQQVIIDGREYRPSSHPDFACDISRYWHLCPWLTKEDHTVLLDGKLQKLQYDAATNTFSFTDLGPVSYYDPASGKNITLEPDEYTLVTEDLREMNNGWYVVNSIVTVPERIYVRGTDVNLVLANGELTANGGINVDPDNALTIWSSKENYTGSRLHQCALVANASGLQFAAGIGADNSYYSRNGDITINGGHIEAIGGYRGGAGIGGGAEAGGATNGVITINAGTVLGCGGGSTSAGIDGGALQVVINGGVVTASGCSSDGVAPNGTPWRSSRYDLQVTINGGSVYSTTSYDRYGVYGNLTNSDGQPLYRLKLYNPKGETVTIDDKVWNTSVHVSNLSRDVGGFEAGYLYAFVPVVSEDCMVHVKVGEQSYTYALINDELHLIDGSENFVPAEYYDPADGEIKTAQLATKFSDLTPDADRQEQLTVSGYQAASWFLVDEDPAGVNVLSIQGDVNLILPEGVTLTATASLEANANLTIWGQKKDATGKLDATEGGIPMRPRANVTINGGVINATSNTGAGIGTPGPGYYTSGTITINHGVVTAQGVAGFPGIGSGGGVPFSVTVTGGVVKAVGGAGAPGIGQTYNATETSIRLSGGTITAQGGEGAPGVALAGAPEGSTNFIIDGDSVKIEGEPMTLQPYNSAGEPVYLLKVYNPKGRAIRINGVEWLDDKPLNHNEKAHDGDDYLYLYLPGEDVTIKLSDQDLADEYTFDETTKTFVKKESFSYYDPIRNGTFSHPALPVTAETITWESGWYVVNSDLGTIQDYITVEGDVDLILADGGSLTIDMYRAITVNEGNSLTIWGQDKQTGKLTVLEAPYAAAGIGGARGGHAAGTITINGGVVWAKGGVYAAGIGGSANHGAGNITINYGTVTAIGGVEVRGFSGAGIGTGWDNQRTNMDAGKVTINGGVVNASGADTRSGGSLGDGAGIGTGYAFAAGVDITINGGTITATGGNGAYGIGAGRNSAYSGGTTVITGGSVNATGALGPVNPRPTNGSVDVYLLTLPNPDGKTVTLAGQSWSPVNHKALDPADGNLYAYIPGQDVIADVGGTQTQYLFENGLFTTEADYDWNNYTWDWSADGASATLNVPRVDGKDPALTRTVLTSMAETKATCEQVGERTYTARVTVHGHSYNGSKTVEIPALGHNWDVTGKVKKPVLSGDRSVTVYCLNDLTHTCPALLKETKNESASTAPNCGTQTDGVTVYDRTFTVDGKEYPLDQVKVTIPWSHTWGEWEDVSETEGTTTFTRHCTVCGAEDEPVDHMHDWHLPSADPHGDANENVKWELGPTYGVTVLHVYCSDEECKYHNGMEVLIDGSQLHYDPDQTINPTCEKAGSTVYEATLTLPGLGSQDVSETYFSRTVTLPPTGHQWGDAEFKFAQNDGAPYDANEKCTITLHCAHCGETRTVEVTVTGAETTAPSCESAGVMSVTAETVYEGQTYTSQPQTRTTPAAGHAYSTATVQWAADHASAVVTLVCAKDGHTMDVTVRNITKTVTEPTCDAQGTTTYTLDAAEAIAAADVQYTGNTVFSDSVPIPATGHDWDVEGQVYGLKPGVDGNLTTLTIFCKTDTSHTQTVYTQLKEVDREDPTCAEQGHKTYRMTYEFEGETHEVENTETYTIPTIPHKWGPWEEVEVAAAAAARAAEDEVWQRECQVCHLTETASHQHVYTLPTDADWNVVNGTPLSVRVAATCETCGEVQVLAYSGDSITVDEELSTEPTCDQDGRTVYSVTVELDGQTRTYLYSQTIPAKGHKWVLNENNGGMSDDHSMYTFVFKCSVCGDTVAKTVSTDSEVLTSATCEEPGLLYYHADLELDGQTYSFTDSKDIPAIGHKWDPAGTVEAPLMETKDGFVTVTIYCTNDHNHTQTVYATRTLAAGKSTAADCTTPGKEVYELSYTFDGEKYDLPQTVEYTIPALGHLWDEHGTCTRCGDKLPDDTYTWDLPDPNDPADSSRIKWSQPPAGGKPYLTLTVYRTDSNGNTVKEEIVITDVTADPHPDCEKVGSTDYTAKVELGGKSETYTTSINDLPPTGHDWTFDEEKDVVWSDDYSEATFTFHCGNEKDGTATKTVKTEQRVTLEPTCEETGTMTLIASAQIDDITATVTKTVTLDALGHDWTYTATWSKDYSEVTFDLVCGRDDSHNKQVTVKAKKETVKAADCTATGLDHVSAAYEENGVVIAADEKDVVTPALGHDYKNGVCTVCGAKDPNYKAPGTAPDTGDGTDLLAWTALLLACAGALTVLWTRRRKE